MSRIEHYFRRATVGVWKDRDELVNSFDLDRKYTPRMDQAEADRLYAGWTKAVQRALAWEEPENEEGDR